MASDPQSLERGKTGLLLGAHVRQAKPDFLLGSVKEALNQNATAFMIFLGPPRNTRECAVPKENAQEALRLFESAGRQASSIAVHFRYVLNPSSPDEEKGAFAASFFDKELCAMEELGLSLCCFHPGSSSGTDRLKAAEAMAERLRPVFARHPNIKIAVETMAGKGSEVGVGLMENKLIVSAFGLENVGTCLDTCHLWDSGLDVTDTAGFCEKIEETIGFEKVFLVHLNDSKNPRGAGCDRHAPLGEGYIGFQALSAICGLRELSSAPKILETPDPGDGSAHKAEIARLFASLGA